jgi:hypothetical protein
LNINSGATLDGYSGTVGVSANGDGTDTVSLSGNAANVRSVSATPNPLTTNQNTPVTFATNVNTSLADTYNLTANRTSPTWQRRKLFSPPQALRQVQAAGIKTAARKMRGRWAA